MTKAETTFVLENASWPALLVNGAGRIVASSKGAKTVFGNVVTNRPTLAQSIWARENGKTAEQFLATLAARSEGKHEIHLHGSDGKSVLYDAFISTSAVEDDTLYIIQVLRPAPSTRTAGAPAVVEAGVAHKQKLDCAMQLIRTVALDFNNALTSILGHSSLLIGKIDNKHPLRSSLVEIEKSAQKAAEISNDLTVFSRQERDARVQSAGNVNDVIRRTVDFFRESHDSPVEWNFEFQRGPFTTSFDEVRMQQVFVKLLENAIQAMEKGGHITVSTRNMEIVDALIDGTAKLAPGAYVCAEIADTGIGIAPDVLPRVFEPFFTTKKESGHRGLGLAWVYGIVTNHGGSVSLSSELNKGTAVRVYLPAQTKVVKDRGQDTGDLTGNQTILMIDDEDLLLTMGEMILSSFGYRVLTANSGQRALDLFAEKASEIDLVITDLVMPQMSGREVIERLRRIAPEIKVICASGFVRPPSAGENENYLQKPFASQDLLRKVKQVLST